MWTRPSLEPVAVHEVNGMNGTFDYNMDKVVVSKSTNSRGVPLAGSGVAGAVAVK